LYLTKNGYEVDEAFDGETALEKIQSGNYDLAVLDLMLPKKDGWAVCRELRENDHPISIIMLTARAEVHERVVGLRMGADDYMVKPFDPNELLARIETVLRRSARIMPASPSSGPITEPSGEFRVGNLSLLVDSFSVSVNAEAVSLTRREFELLCFLVQRAGKVFAREDLISQIWGWDFNGEDRVVDLYVQRIRRKLGAAEGWSLTTVWGIGYKFEVTSSC
jgi:two-component system response regulator ResD